MPSDLLHRRLTLIGLACALGMPVVLHAAENDEVQPVVQERPFRARAAQALERWRTSQAADAGQPAPSAPTDAPAAQLAPPPGDEAWRSPSRLHFLYRRDRGVPCGGLPTLRRIVVGALLRVLLRIVLVSRLRVLGIHLVTVGVCTFAHVR